MPNVRPYAELHCKTNFSFLHGASHAAELVTRAAELGYAALAVTDRNSLAGIVRAHVAAKTSGFKLIIGAEIALEDAYPVLLHAADLAGYRRLASLITLGRRSAPKGESLLFFRDLASRVGDESGGGLLAVIVVPTTASDEDAAIVQKLGAFGDLFGDCCHLAVSLHRSDNDDGILDRFVHLSKKSRLPLVATNDVHYHDRCRQPLHDVLTAIRHGLAVQDLGPLRFPNAERHLKTPGEMWRLFRRYPQAIHNTLGLAERCRFALDELRYEYPAELCPPGKSAIEHLSDLTWRGAAQRYGVDARSASTTIPQKVRMLLERELELIAELRYEAFFLTVWDVVAFARGRGILCQGRGSAANSAVCYCLGITSVDPDRHDLLFERFISRERNEAPDIDVDFEHERREEVMQYIYGKYGRDRAGLVAEVITYRPRSAIRDVGKALGLSLDAVDRLSQTLHTWSDEAEMPQRILAAGLDPAAPRTRQLIALSKEILGFPRHLSQHVGGFVITGGPLSDLVPIENAAMPERTVIQWDKDDIDALGILKVDCLSLGMLTAIRKCFELVRRHHGRELTLASVPAEDEAVYDMICRADTVGVFQIESRAQMSMLPRLRPRCFYDLVIEVAIVRPGPIQGGMVHPFLRRRSGEEPVVFPDPAVEGVLKKTLGVPLFQEQVMRLAMVTAGFTAGEADQLRRAMASWGKPGSMDPFRDKLRQGMLEHGLPPAFAEQIFEQIRGFGQYGFPESHAASFALLAYVSAWLKCHYPAAYAAALINSQPMGFYAPAQIVRDAQEHGIEARSVDVNFSDWDCTLEVRGDARIGGASPPRFCEPGLNDDWALRLGLRLIRGMPQAVAERLVAQREQGSYRSVIDLARRAGLSRAVLARLAAADACRSLGLHRRDALWQVLTLGEELPLFADLDEEVDLASPLADHSLDQHVRLDYHTVGLSLKAHPIGLLREELNQLKITTAADLAKIPDKGHVRVAGLILVRQQPSTAKGTIFYTLEDETGTINLVLWPAIWKRFRAQAFHAVALLAEGRLERASGVTHVMPTRLEDLTQSLRGLGTRSRDFR